MKLLAVERDCQNWYVGTLSPLQQQLSERRRAVHRQQQAALQLFFDRMHRLRSSCICLCEAKDGICAHRCSSSLARGAGPSTASSKLRCGFVTDIAMSSALYSFVK